MTYYVEEFADVPFDIVRILGNNIKAFVNDIEAEPEEYLECPDSNLEDDWKVGSQEEIEWIGHFLDNSILVHIFLSCSHMSDSLEGQVDASKDHDEVPCLPPDDIKDIVGSWVISTSTTISPVKMEPTSWMEKL